MSVSDPLIKELKGNLNRLDACDALTLLYISFSSVIIVYLHLSYLAVLEKLSMDNIGI